MRRLPNGSVFIVDSQATIGIVLFVATLFFAAVAWLVLRSPHPRYLIVAGLIIAALVCLVATFVMKKRTFLFEPSHQRLTWTSRGLLAWSKAVVPFSDISEVRMERFADGDDVKYRVAVVVPRGSLPLSNGFEVDKENISQLAALISAVLGWDPTQPINVVDWLSGT